MQLHGGTIHAVSEGEGKGSSFVYKIPMKKYKMAQNQNDSALSPPVEDEKVDNEYEFRPASPAAIKPDPPLSLHNNNCDIVPLSPRDVGRLNHHHANHHRPSVVSAISNESRNMAARRLSSFRLSNPSVVSNHLSAESHRESPPRPGGIRGPASSSSNSSVPHVASSSGHWIRDEHSSASEVRREEYDAFNTDNILAEAQRKLLAEATSIITGTTTTAVGAKLQAIIEASTNNSRCGSVNNSVKNVPVLPPLTESESERQEQSSLPIQQQLALSFENTNGMAGGGGAGSINMQHTLPRSGNQVTHGHGGAIASSEVVAVESTGGGFQGSAPVCSDTKKPDILSVVAPDGVLTNDKPSSTSSQRKIRITKATPQTTTASRLFHILMVDDSDMSRKMLRRTLLAVGHTCDEAEDGLIAVGMVKDKGLTTYDAILMDFVMVSPSPPPSSPILLSPPFPSPLLLFSCSSPLSYRLSL